MMNARSGVVVITGASSGIGRAASVLFARRGYTVFLAARRQDALDETARQCRSAGGEAFCIPTDVTQEVQVHELAVRVLEQVGRIDVWVNNAGVTVFAPLSELSTLEHRRVIETNVYGALYGAQAVLPIFRRQGSGVLINVGSILSKIGQPFVPSYVMSKFALRGLSEVLRVEIADEPGIHVCTLLPYAVDTPHFQEGANRVGFDPHAMPPVQSPEKVARALVHLAEHPRRELHVPRIASAGLALHALMPRTVERVLARALKRWHFGTAHQKKGVGNLFWPVTPVGSVHGDRRPVVSTARLLAWAFTEFLWIQAGDIGRHLRPSRARLTGQPAPLLTEANQRTVP